MDKIYERLESIQYQQSLYNKADREKSLLRLWAGLPEYFFGVLFANDKLFSLCCGLVIDCLASCICNIHCKTGRLPAFFISQLRVHAPSAVFILIQINCAQDSTLELIYASLLQLRKRNGRRSRYDQACNGIHRTTSFLKALSWRKGSAWAGVGGQHNIV